MKSTLAAGLALGLSSFFATGLFATGAMACTGGGCALAPASAGYVFGSPDARPAPPRQNYYAPPAAEPFRGWPPAYAAPRAQPQGYGGEAYEGYGAPNGYDYPPEAYGPPPVAQGYGPEANPNYPCLSCAPPPVYAPRPCPKAQRPAPIVCLAPEPETVSLKGDFFTGGVGDTDGAYAGGGGWGYGGDNFVYSGGARDRLSAFVGARSSAGAGVSVHVNASAYASARSSARSGGPRGGGGCKSCGGGKRGGGKH